MHRRGIPAFIHCQRGVAAVELAFVAPILFGLTIGGLSTGLVVYSAAGLHDAVEQAARCYSVNSAQCGSATKAQTYAKSAYYGMNTPKFTASIQPCGHQVTASVSVQLSAIITEIGVPLTAQACFP